MSKKMITIAEIMFAVVFIILMAVIFSTVNGFGNNANKTLENIKQSIEDADLASYDNDAIVSGDTVVSAINKMTETKNGLKLSYRVDSNSYGYQAIGTSGSQLVKSDGTAVSEKCTSAKDEYISYTAKINQSGFINPVDKYKSNLVFNSNGVLIGIIFKKA